MIENKTANPTQSFGSGGLILCYFKPPCYQNDNETKDIDWYNMSSINEASIDKDMSEKFHVIYDGVALDEHLMDVRDLSPAMLAISDLFVHVNKELNGDTLEIQLKVKANFKAGSFGMEFTEVLSWVSQMRDLLISNNAMALSNASGILALIGFFGGKGLIQLYKELKGKPPVKIEESLENAKVFYSETECIEVSKDVLRLYRNRTIAADINKMLEPLNKEGIDSFYVVRDSDKNNAELAITKDEIPYFEYHEIESDLSENTTETFVQIEAAVFKDNNKWKFDNGGSPINAAILDEEFLRKIDSGELRFGKGDLLKVKLKTIQTFAHGKLKTEFQVIEVLEHKIVKQGHLEF